MNNYKLNLKKKNLKKLNYILKNYDYVYICKHNNLKIKDTYESKIILKKKNISSFIIKQNLFSLSTQLKLRGQNSIMLIYSNNLNNVDLISTFKNIQILFFLKKTKLIPVLKLQKILNNRHNFIPLLNFMSFSLVNTLNSIKN